MRVIKSSEIADAVASLCEPAATQLPDDVLEALKTNAAGIM